MYSYKQEQVCEKLAIATHCGDISAELMILDLFGQAGSPLVKKGNAKFT